MDSVLVANERNHV